MPVWMFWVELEWFWPRMGAVADMLVSRCMSCMVTVFF